MRRRLLCAIALFVLMMNTACYYPGTPAETGLYAPFCILKVNVPFADNLHTVQWDKVSLLEVDAYGRHYYSYKTYSIMLKCHIEIHVICQAEMDNRQYSYYQDRCYMIRKNDDEIFSEDDVAQLKVNNDWDLPIVNEELSYTDRENCYSQIVYDESLSKDISRYLKLDDTYGVLYNAMECISDTSQLFFVNVFSKLEDSNEEWYYLVVYRTDGTQPISVCEEIPLALKCQDNICNFRKAVLSQLIP